MDEEKIVEFLKEARELQVKHGIFISSTLSGEALLTDAQSHISLEDGEGNCKVFDDDLFTSYETFSESIVGGGNNERTGN